MGRPQLDFRDSIKFFYLDYGHKYIPYKQYNPSKIFTKVYFIGFLCYKKIYLSFLLAYLQFCWPLESDTLVHQNQTPDQLVINMANMQEMLVYKQLL